MDFSDLRRSTWSLKFHGSCVFNRSGALRLEAELGYILQRVEEDRLGIVLHVGGLLVLGPVRALTFESAQRSGDERENIRARCTF